MKIRVLQLCIWFQLDGFNFIVVISGIIEGNIGSWEHSCWRYHRWSPWRSHRCWGCEDPEWKSDDLWWSGHCGSCSKGVDRWYWLSGGAGGVILVVCIVVWCLVIYCPDERFKTWLIFNLTCAGFVFGRACVGFITIFFCLAYRA
jgi:hypothetical protein